MSKPDNEKLFRIAFLNHGKVYELFCKEVSTSGLLGFVEVSGLEFADGDSLVVDPTEEKMRDEFDGVEVLHLPIHSVLRVEHGGDGGGEGLFLTAVGSMSGACG